jgi:outer membrane protein assembly factor BamB
MLNRKMSRLVTASIVCVVLSGLLGAQSTQTRASGNWPSFRGIAASGITENQNLPDKWNVRTGDNILWRTSIPGLGHSSPIVWGNQLFVTSAVSSDPNATFRPGLYGDGDASADRSRHRWMLYALDKRNASPLKERPSTKGILNPHTRALHLPRMAELLWRHLDRRASTLMT